MLSKLILIALALPAVFSSPQPKRDARDKFLNDENISSFVTHKYHIINGFTINGNEDLLNRLLSSSDVESITEDGIASTFATQTDAPWGIARLSSSGKLVSDDSTALNYTYNYDDSAGAGVDIYVVDTGIRVTHEQFEGRASWGATFGGYPEEDGNGHGTHCAGTIASRQFGVAKAAHLIAVRVFSDGGFAPVADMISGLEYVMDQAELTGRPSVASLSFGTLEPMTALDDAVESLTSAGIHVAVAAGNFGVDANMISPARASSAITVGATDIQDARAIWSPVLSSDVGSVVDIWAPGTDIISTWNTSDTATHILNGTSMATPHIAGLVAYLIGLEGNVSPADMASKIQGISQKGIISGIPSGTGNDFGHITS